MATIGPVNRSAPNEPWNTAPPSENTPPSAEASQYPWWAAVDAGSRAMATITDSSGTGDGVLMAWASPKSKTPPPA